MKSFGLAITQMGDTITNSLASIFSVLQRCAAAFKKNQYLLATNA